MIYNAACEHFSLKPKHKIEDFLPPPTVPQITIDKISPDHQKLLHEIVRQVYVINRDDFNTREIAMVEPEKEANSSMTFVKITPSEGNFKIPN